MSLRVFKLARKHDVSGVSGTGIVGYVTEYPNGWCSVCWTIMPEYPSMVVYPSLAVAKKIHGHNGATEFIEMVELLSIKEAKETRYDSL